MTRHQGSCTYVSDGWDCEIQIRSVWLDVSTQFFFSFFFFVDKCTHTRRFAVEYLMSSIVFKVHHRLGAKKICITAQYEFSLYGGF